MAGVGWKACMSTVKSMVVLGLPCPFCSRGLVYFKERPFAGDFVTTKLSFNHDTKRQPVDGDDIRCQWCGVMTPKPLFLPRNVTIFDYETGDKI